MQSGLEITRRHPVIELTQWQNEWNHTNFLGAIIGHRHLLCLDGCGLVLQITKSSGKSAFDPKLPGPVEPIHYGPNSIKNGSLRSLQSTEFEITVFGSRQSLRLLPLGFLFGSGRAEDLGEVDVYYSGHDFIFTCHGGCIGRKVSFFGNAESKKNWSSFLWSPILLGLVGWISRQIKVIPVYFKQYTQSWVWVSPEPKLLELFRA